MRTGDFLVAVAGSLIVVLAGACSAGPAFALELKSEVFENGGYIPEKYTCKGKDISPVLGWNDVPRGTKSFALIMDDPDAPMGTWVHWVVYGIPAETRYLQEDMPKRRVLRGGIRQGMNSFKRIGYGGPCPPPGPAHRYTFKLYALNVKVDISPGISKESLLRMIKDHIIEKAELTGLFKR